MQWRAMSARPWVQAAIAAEWRPDDNKWVQARVAREKAQPVIPGMQPTREGQGLTLVHFSVQLEPCLTHKNTLHPINTP